MCVCIEWVGERERESERVSEASVVTAGIDRPFFCFFFFHLSHCSCFCFFQFHLSVARKRRGWRRRRYRRRRRGRRRRRPVKIEEFI